MPIPEFFMGLGVRASPYEINMEKHEVQKQYFRSWVSYSIPMKPRDPISYADTVDSISYYIGYFDRGGRLIRFIKYIRQEQDADIINFSDRINGDRATYYEALRIENEKYRIGSRIDFERTEGLDAYFKIYSQNNTKGRHPYLVVTHTEFDDKYEYWPNGKLKTRTIVKSDGSRRQTFYNEQGQETATTTQP
ncbi:hypothetical protein [Azospirillum argentinense]|uniref:hypothetical protein n=1 Tax=Azospirillum argentinense TaxID=2970906 RepID=UPI0032DEF21F